MDTRLILDALEDPDVIERTLSRREAFGGLGKWGAGLALASMPVALAALTKKAVAQAPSDRMVLALNFAYFLEFLEDDFYVQGLDASGLIPAEDRPIFEQVSKHESAHVAFLGAVLGPRGAIRPTFDFTANGMFPDVFSNYETFTLLAQGFEDTGVRAYKGQAGALAGSDLLLSAALRIHSVEARHASEIRRLRGQKGWPTDTDPPAPALAATYAGEENTMQLGMDTATLGGGEPGLPDAVAAAEAFDEPLSIEQVLPIAALFGTRGR